jgi:nucleoside-diphosphate-sugar epimerase
MQVLFEWVRQGHNVPVLGDGANLYQFVHAEDLADACLAAAARPGPSVYNVGATDFCSMRQTLEGLVAHAQTGSRVVSVPMRPAVIAMKAASRLGISPLGAYHSLMYGRSMYFDTRKAQAELGFRPRWGNVDMFCQSYDWYLAHRLEVLARHGASHHRSPVKQGALRAVNWVLG